LHAHDLEKDSSPGKGFFSGLKFLVGGVRYSLDEIEKGVLLGDPMVPEPRRSSFRSVAPDPVDARVHMALVCGSIGCPPLAREAYDPQRIDAQLTERVRAFARDPRRCRIDARNRRLDVSELLNWYAHDFSNAAFVPHAASVPDFLSRFVDDADLARALKQDGWRVSYLAYDWMLNLKR